MAMQTVSEPPSTPLLRWSPVKRVVTAERGTLQTQNALGSPLSLHSGRVRKSVAHRSKSLAPPPPLVALAPARLNTLAGSPVFAATKPQIGNRLLTTKARSHPPATPQYPPDTASARTHAKRLRARLQLAYYKVRTNQAKRTLNEICQICQ